MNGHIRKMSCTLSVALAAGASLAGGALAGGADDRPGPHGVGGIATHGLVLTSVALRPDDRPGTLGIAPSAPTARAATLETVVVRPRAQLRPDDRPGLRRAGTSLPAVPAAAAVDFGTGFHWTDAGIGAAGAFAAVLIVGAAYATVRRTDVAQ